MRVRKASQSINWKVILKPPTFYSFSIFCISGSPNLLDKVEDAVRIYQVNSFGKISYTSYRETYEWRPSYSWRRRIRRSLQLAGYQLDYLKELCSAIQWLTHCVGPSLYQRQRNLMRHRNFWLKSSYLHTLEGSYHLFGPMADSATRLIR